MNTIVTDTSVFIKWLNRENEDSIDQADKILHEAQEGKIQIIAPELLKYEIGNVLLKGKQLFPQTGCNIPWDCLFPTGKYIAESEQQAKDTYTVAHKFGISYYDASFISLAKRYDAVLITDNLKHQGKDPEIKAISLEDY